MTTNTMLAILALLCYSLALVTQFRRVLTNVTHWLTQLNPANLAGIILHGYLLHRLIDLRHTQNLAVFNLFSLIAWLVLVLLTFASLKKFSGNLLLIALPIALLSIGLLLLFPQVYLIDTGAAPKMLVHILLSTFTFSILCIGALQAVLLGVQEWLLRHQQASRFIQLLPPLETMETVLFRLLAVGFCLLTLVLLNSVLVFPHLLISPIWQKLLLSVVAWSVFAALLLGRWRFGLRGRTAIHSTLFGVLIIALVYFGSVIL